MALVVLGFDNILVVQVLNMVKLVANPEGACRAFYLR